jgi:hypothetical protein
MIEIYTPPLETKEFITIFMSQYLNLVIEYLNICINLFKYHITSYLK